MDWVVAFTTIICVELMIHRKWYAWLLALLNQGVWLTFIITREQYGLLPLNIMMVIQNTRGLITWWRLRRKADAADRMSDTTHSSGRQSP